jgi:hypothetical protein
MAYKRLCYLIFLIHNTGVGWQYDAALPQCLFTRIARVWLVNIYHNYLYILVYPMLRSKITVIPRPVTSRGKTTRVVIIRRRSRALPRWRVSAESSRTTDAREWEQEVEILENHMSKKKGLFPPACFWTRPADSHASWCSHRLWIWRRTIIIVCPFSGYSETHICF